MWTSTTRRAVSMRPSNHAGGVAVIRRHSQGPPPLLERRRTLTGVRASRRGVRRGAPAPRRHVRTGVFGAMMRVSLVIEGTVTLVLDS
jgi:hypothetical protein